MDNSTKQQGSEGHIEHESHHWQTQAWVYFVWIAFGSRVYCKIGYSTNSASRFAQIATGFPERPYRIHLLPCLSAEQAKVVESIPHDHAAQYKTRGEWFSHANVTYLDKVLVSKVKQIMLLFRSFGYEVSVKTIHLDGPKPILNSRGYVSQVMAVDAAKEDIQ
ncbi:MAG: GIY-YIG nuclease family protein [Anaerolineae bacterium]